MKLISLLQRVDKLQQAGKVDNLQQEYGCMHHLHFQYSLHHESQIGFNTDASQFPIQLFYRDPLLNILRHS